uniref:Uncharacterized protein n=1 Tax=Knipowitschia caucasica TaxID=637954 RepID=A0AAV2J0B6_KNICA
MSLGSQPAVSSLTPGRPTDSGSHGPDSTEQYNSLFQTCFKLKADSGQAVFLMQSDSSHTRAVNCCTSVAVCVTGLKASGPLRVEGYSRSNPAVASECVNVEEWDKSSQWRRLRCREGDFPADERSTSEVGGHEHRWLLRPGADAALCHRSKEIHGGALKHHISDKYISLSGRIPHRFSVCSRQIGIKMESCQRRRRSQTAAKPNGGKAKRRQSQTAAKPNGGKAKRRRCQTRSPSQYH